MAINCTLGVQPARLWASISPRLGLAMVLRFLHALLHWLDAWRMSGGDRHGIAAICQRRLVGLRERRLMVGGSRCQLFDSRNQLVQIPIVNAPPAVVPRGWNSCVSQLRSSTPPRSTRIS